MIITKLKGGLGNQLFQYAFGSVLSKLNNTELKLDIEGYNVPQRKETRRVYSLSNFNIKAEIASHYEIKRFKYPFGIISKIWRLFKAKVLRVHCVGYNPKALAWRGNLYIDGFWQSEKYFVSFERDIRSELTLKSPMSAFANTFKDSILNEKNSISIHIRRGDLILNMYSDPHAGICTPEYYSKAFDYIKSQIKTDGRVFFFSDDIEWVKDNIKTSFPASYVSCPEITDYEELVLMSLCKHNIIANSSFSWWGAWLNENKKKIIIAPSRWVTKGEDDYVDITPPSWIRI